MKKYINNLIVLLLAVGIFSCKDFLEREPLDQLTTDNFYKTVDDAERAVLSVYSPMMDNEWNGEGWKVTEIPSDDTQPGGTDPEFIPIDNFTVTADNNAITSYWAIHYKQVTLANVVIEKATEMEIDEVAKNAIIGEAMFLRAVAYFDLVRLYGGVPLVTKPPVFGDDLLLPRSSVSQVYGLIKSDLQFAIDHLPIERQGPAVGRATKGAAMSYLASAHLTLREYIESRDMAKAIMDLGVYQLMPDFGMNFELASCDNNEESIFQIQFVGCGPFGTGNSLQAFFAPWGEGITKDRDGWGSQVPTSPQQSNPRTTIQDAFEPDDLRRYHSFMKAGDHYPNINPEDGGYTYPTGGASATAINIKKYVVGGGGNVCFMSTPHNTHLMRYSEVLLMYAESIMEIEGGESSNPEALGAFNQVRARAGLEPLNKIDRELMLQERRVEFAFENHRWFDLIRSRNVIERMALHGKNVEQHHLKFPIPASEIAVNPNLDQNPGY